MAALAGGVRVLAYAEGMYNKVLGMGLSASVPRVTLYFALTPILGGLGAASAYLVGSIGSLTAALAAAKSMKFKIGLRRFSVLVALPASVGGLVYWLGLNWAVGAALILAGSLLGYAKLGLLSKRDLGDLLKALLPTELLDEAYRKYKWMVELLFRE
ncbi:TPA: hypothetical protein EYP26_04950 [Candidatus Bathyarchaeota archaeon]|nr:hypothetical protein [Candidatus Bathyarchaeota archaeon]